MVSSLAAFLALDDIESWWQKAVHESFLWKITFGPLNFLAKQLGSTENAQKLGDLLQQISFILVLVLCVALGLPQFANDKEGLALISLASLIVWTLGYLLGGKENREAKPQDMLVLLYLAANLIATAASHYLGPSIHGLAKTAVYVASYFLFTTILSQPKRKIAVMIALVITGLILSFYGFYQYKIGVAPLATWEDPTVEIKETRIFATLGNPNLLAGYLVPLVPLALGLGAIAINKKRWLYGALSIGSALAIAIATFLTQSRGGWIALAAGTGFMLLTLGIEIWTQRPSMRLPILISGLALIGMISFAYLKVPTFQHRFASIFAGREHSSNSFRLNVYRSSFKMFRDNWWFGVGPGNQAFRLAYGLYMTSGFDALGTYCVPLEVGVETGVFGLAIFGLLVASTLAKAHKTFWSDLPPTSKWISAACGASLIGLMVHGLFDTVFYRPQVHFIFWLVIAMVVTQPKEERD